MEASTKVCNKCFTAEKCLGLRVEYCQCCLLSSNLAAISDHPGFLHLQYFRRAPSAGEGFMTSSSKRTTKIALLTLLILTLMRTVLAQGGATGAILGTVQ